MIKKCISIAILLIISLTYCTLDTTADEGNWPNESNTGLTDPGALTDSSGVSVTTDGTTVSNLKIVGDLTIEADNVTIRNCRLYGSSLYGVIIYSGTGIVIEDCEIGMDSPSSKKGINIRGLANTELTIRRCYLHHLDDAIFIGGDPAHTIINDITIEYSYIADLIRNDPSDRPDGLEALNGSITLRHNRFGDADYMNSNLQLQCSNGDFGDITLDNNWFNGGGYSIKLRDYYASYDFTGNIVIINNVFSRGYDHGLLDIDTVVIPHLTAVYGNVWYDTGEPVSDVAPQLE